MHSSLTTSTPDIIHLSIADAYNNTTPTATGFSTTYTPYTTGQGLWGQKAQDTVFAALGNQVYTLKGGVDYSAANGMKAELGDLITGYDLFGNRDEVQVDYLLQDQVYLLKQTLKQKQIN